MKKIVLFIVLNLLVMPLLAQQSKDSILAVIAETQKQNVDKQNTYVFRQTKHSPMFISGVVSNGKMVYGPAKYLVWQYTTPKKFSLIVMGDSIYTKSDGQRTPLSGNNGRIARRITKIMKGLAEGNSLFDSRVFSTALSSTAKTYVVTLIPQKREMRSIMQKLYLTFDKTTKDILAVKIEGNDDSFTLIEFTKQ